MSRQAKPKTGLGERLKKLRAAAGMTQPQLAARLGELAVGTVSRWERETGSPQAEQLVALSDLFDVSLDYLMFGDESTEADVHSPELHKFLTMTAHGKYAREHKLVSMLLHVPSQLATLDVYRQVTMAIRMAIEEASDDGSARPEPSSKKPAK